MGEMFVPEGRWAFWQRIIPFQVEGPATYEQITTALRDPAAAPIQ